MSRVTASPHGPNARNDSRYQISSRAVTDILDAIPKADAGWSNTHGSKGGFSPYGQPAYLIRSESSLVSVMHNSGQPHRRFERMTALGHWAFGRGLRLDRPSAWCKIRNRKVGDFRHSLGFACG